ncbi:hypothetical protein D3C71_1524150 [compost metagenome]
MHVERNPFLITVAARFAAHQQGGKVVTTGFGRGGDGIWRHAVPGRNHRIDALLQRLFTQVRAPRKRRDNHVCLVAGRRVNPHADVAHKHQRANISADQVVFTQRSATGFHQLINAL